MKKIAAILSAVTLILVLFSGCSSLRGAIAGIQEKVESLSSDSVIVRVTKVEEDCVRAQVVIGDSHFDEKDNIYLYYDQIVGTNKVEFLDEISVFYDYARDVSLSSGTPVIRVDVVSLYIPED